MRRFGTAALALAVLALGLAVLAAPAQAEVGSASSGPGLDALTACLAQDRHLDLLVLMDESASLSSPDLTTGQPPSDPRGERVVALKSLLQGLAAKSSVAAASQVSVGFAGFASAFDE